MVSNQLKQYLAVIFLTGLLPNLSLAVPRCKALFQNETSYFNRQEVEDTFRWHDNASFMSAYINNSINGVVKNFYSSRWDTQVYYTATGARRPGLPRETTLIDQDANAVFIFIHGSGTVKSGGRNFIHNMNTVANLGFAAISIDLPFHSHGPTNDKYLSKKASEATMEFLKRIVDDVKAQGKPIYFVGHSFGPDIIFEFSSRYQNVIDGALCVSPAGFNSVLQNWYDKKTSKMNFGGDVMTSELGSRYSGIVSSQLKWQLGSYPDPTLNPNFKLIILSGDHEEYVPAPTGGPNRTPIGKNTYDISKPLRQIFAHAKIVIESGVGHYIFEHKDAEGYNVFNKYLLELVDTHPRQMKALSLAKSESRNKMTNAEKLAAQYDSDSLLRTYVDQVYAPKGGPRLIDSILQREDNLLAKNIFDAFLEDKKIRETEILKSLLDLKTTHPTFYETNKQAIENSIKTGDTGIFPLYLNFRYGIVITP